MITNETIYRELQAMRREISSLKSKVQPIIEPTWISHAVALEYLGKPINSRYMERVIRSGKVSFKGKGAAAKFLKKDIEALHEGRIHIYTNTQKSCVEQR